MYDAINSMQIVLSKHFIADELILLLVIYLQTVIHHGRFVARIECSQQALQDICIAILVQSIGSCIFIEYFSRSMASDSLKFEIAASLHDFFSL